MIFVLMGSPTMSAMSVVFVAASSGSRVASIRENGTKPSWDTPESSTTAPPLHHQGRHTLLVGSPGAGSIKPHASSIRSPSPLGVMYEVRRKYGCLLLDFVQVVARQQSWRAVANAATSATVTLHDGARGIVVTVHRPVQLFDGAFDNVAGLLQVQYLLPVLCHQLGSLRAGEARSVARWIHVPSSKHQSFHSLEPAVVACCKSHWLTHSLQQTGTAATYMRALTATAVELAPACNGIGRQHGSSLVVVEQQTCAAATEASRLRGRRRVRCCRGCRCCAQELVCLPLLRGCKACPRQRTAWHCCRIHLHIHRESALLIAPQVGKEPSPCMPA